MTDTNLPHNEELFDDYDEWRAACRAVDPDCTFTKETGAGETYGDIGDWDCLRSGGVDHQADVIGAWVSAYGYGLLFHWAV